MTYHAWRTWEQVNNIPLAQLDHVSTDAREPFYGVTVGMQENGAWIGPSRTHKPGGTFNDDWRMLGPFTGFNALTAADDPDVIIHEQPRGGLLRTNTRAHEQHVIPRSYSGAPAGEMKYRFNWDAPWRDRILAKTRFTWPATWCFNRATVAGVGRISAVT